MIYAYVRVSDMNKQDSSNQRKVISDYAIEKNLTVDNWSEFNISGSKSDKSERGISDLLANLKKGDVVIISDIARLGRDDIHSVINTITTITGAGAELHLAYSKTAITQKHKNDIGKMFMLIGEAYASVKFSEERSQKAKVAHAKRKASGLTTGRTKGSKNKKNKLDAYAVLVLQMLDKKATKGKILKTLEKKGVSVSRATLYRYISEKLSGKGINKK